MKGSSRGRSGITGAAAVMFIATLVSGGSDYLFQIVMGRSLGADAYSELAAVLSILYIVSIPALSVQNIMTRYVSKFHAEGKDGQISWLMRRSLVWVAAFSFLASGAMLALSGMLMSALALSSLMVVALLCVSLFFRMLNPVAAGPLQGLQRFNEFGGQLSAQALVKLGAGWLLVLLGFGIGGALWGVALGAMASTLIPLAMMRAHVVQKGDPFPMAGLWRYSVPAMMGVLAITILTNVDVVVARFFFDGVSAGLYAASSNLAKVILFLPGAVSYVMLPKVSDAYTKGEDIWHIVLKAFGINIALSLAMVAGYVLLADPLISMLYGSEYDGASIYLGILALSMSLFGMANLFMILGLSMDSFGYIWIQLFFTVVQVSLFMLFHEQLMQLAWSMLAVGLGICLSSGILMMVGMRRGKGVPRL